MASQMIIPKISGLKAKMTPQMMKKLAFHLGKGGLFGAIIGVGAALFSFGSKLKNCSADELDFNLDYLKMDSQMLEAFLDLRQFSTVSPPISDMYFERIGKGCDKLVQSYTALNQKDIQNPGVQQFRAHRHVVEIRTCIKEMGKLCLKMSSSENMTPTNFHDYAHVLETCVDNYVHNICLQNTYTGDLFDRVTDYSTFA